MAIDIAVALISLNDAKAFLKVTANTDDGIIGDLINGVSQMINQYCGRTLLSATYTDYLDGTGSAELLLPNYPVTAITSINDDVDRVWAAGDNIDITTNVNWEGTSGIVRLWNNEYGFSKGNRNVKVVYVAGYSLATMPYDVALACKLLVSQHYRQSYSQWRRGIQSEQMGDRNITFTNEAIPKDVALLLAPYRIARIGIC